MSKNTPKSFRDILFMVAAIDQQMMINCGVTLSDSRLRELAMSRIISALFRKRKFFITIPSYKKSKKKRQSIQSDVDSLKAHVLSLQSTLRSLKMFPVDPPESFIIDFIKRCRVEDGEIIYKTKNDLYIERSEQSNIRREQYKEHRKNGIPFSFMVDEDVTTVHGSEFSGLLTGG